MTTPPLVGGSLTPSDVEALRKVAEEATPGPWRVSDFERLSGGDNRALMGADNYMIGYISGRSEPEHDRDAAFIATFNPSRVLALLLELEAVKEQLKEAGTYTEAHERLDDLARERIAAAEAALSTLKREVVDGLKLAEGWFRDYERQHRAKGTSEGNLKADTNEERAEFLALLSGRVGGSDSTDIAASREPEWLEITLQHLDGAATALRQHGDEYRAQLIESGAHAIRQGSALSPPPPQSGEGIGKQDE
jgi:hypothetical protein